MGLKKPGNPKLEKPPNLAGLEFPEPNPEACKVVLKLRNEEHVDLVIVAMHMGLGVDLRTGEKSPGEVPHENEAVTIARQVPGIDLILMGHTHRDVPSLEINIDGESGGALLTQADRWGIHVARSDFYLDKNVKGQWRVIARSATTIPVTDRTEADPDLLKLAESYNRETQDWLARPIGTSPEDLSAQDARFRDTAILDLIQRVQLEAGKADVSMAANFNAQARIAKGPVTVRDIAGLYIYENTLVVIEVTGAQLKSALEHSAKYFREYQPGKTPMELVDERIPSFNFDIAEGVEYDLDIAKPIGQRIQNLSFHGKPVDPNQKFRLAVNNYRVNGGGGYTMYKDAPVVYRSSEEIRDLIIDWVERNKTIPPQPDNNWRIVTGGN